MVTPRRQRIDEIIYKIWEWSELWFFYITRARADDPKKAANRWEPCLNKWAKRAMVFLYRYFLLVSEGRSDDWGGGNEAARSAEFLGSERLDSPTSKSPKSRPQNPRIRDLKMPEIATSKCPKSRPQNARNHDLKMPEITTSKPPKSRPQKPQKSWNAYFVLERLFKDRQYSFFFGCRINAEILRFL